MKAIDHFEQNRPVHLARRDIYFERAAELISAQQQSESFQVSLEIYEGILYLLRVARQHAQFSIRNKGKNEDDEQFCRFLNLLAGNVKAVLSMLNLKSMVDDDGGSFFTFLGTNQASAALQSEEYERRAMDVARSINKTLMLAQEPFDQLKIINYKSATEEQRSRYKKARSHFSQLVAKSLPTHRPLPGYRKGLHY